MLIIQIALGIVLAVIVLMYLPQIFSLGIWVALLALGIAVVVGVVFLAMEYLVVTLVLAIFVGGIILVVHKENSHDASLDKEKKRRKIFGYDD